MGRLAACLALALAACAQDPLPAPDAADVAYGPHPRQVLDLWRPSSGARAPLVVYLHGGGFVGGDKGGVPAILLQLATRAGIAVASVNYRLSSDAPYPAPMRDGARAIQFLRAHAAEYNLDPNEVCATGGSAGGGIALWVAFHDDLADAASADPVERASSRLECAAGSGAQSTYDPHVAARLIGPVLFQYPGLDRFYGIPAGEWNTGRARAVFADASPVTHLSPDDPPVFVAYDMPNAPLDDDLPLGHAAHHPRFGTYLKEQAAKVGVAVTVRMTEDYSSADAKDLLWKDMVEFFRKELIH